MAPILLVLMVALLFIVPQVVQALALLELVGYEQKKTRILPVLAQVPGGSKSRKE